MADLVHGHHYFCYRRYALRLRRGSDLVAGVRNLDARNRFHGWGRLYAQARGARPCGCVLPQYEFTTARLGRCNWRAALLVAAVRFPGNKVFRLRDNFLVNA